MPQTPSQWVIIFAFCASFLGGCGNPALDLPDMQRSPSESLSQPQSDVRTPINQTPSQFIGDQENNDLTLVNVGAQAPIYKSVSLPSATIADNKAKTVVTSTATPSPVKIDTTPIFSYTPSAGCEKFLGMITPTATICSNNSSAAGLCNLGPQQIPSQMQLVFRGAASRWDMRMLVTQPGTSNIRLVQREVSVNQFRDAQDPYKYRVPMAQFIGDSEMQNVKQIRIVGLEGNGNPYSQECSIPLPGYYPGMKPQYNSPIVLDFSGAKKLQTISVLDSHIYFDIDGDGQEERTGWIQKGTGFLALDRNLNGLIDDASELFGEHTAFQSYENGYIPLAELDESSKGYIDETDSMFHELVVWFDENLDGISQSEELKSLAGLGVSRIDTTHEQLPALDSEWENKISFRSRFYGPAQCGIMGCPSYDVFFGSF